MIKPIASILTLVLLCATAIAAPNTSPPVPVPYAADRKLAETDFVRFDWTDAARNRAVPAKIYYPQDVAGPLPVILFSHGLGGTRETYEYLGRQWAANGYIAIHLQHPGSDDTAWRGQARPMQSMRQAASYQNAVDRAKDVKFVLDKLESLNRDDATLKGRLDLKHIGMAGHSFGAQTTMLMIGQRMGGGAIGGKLGAGLGDDRIIAAIPMSAGAPMIRTNLDDVFAAVKVPVFYMTGTKDDSPIGDTKAADRRIPFDHTSNSLAAYLLTFTGGDHMTFSGRVVRDGAANDATFQKEIRLASTAFWDAYLKNDADAKKWLAEGGFAAAIGEDGKLEIK